MDNLIMINIREKVESFLDKTSSYMLSGKRKQKTTLYRLNYFKLYLILWYLPNKSEKKSPQYFF